MFIVKLDNECLYLLCQAFNGTALPWFLPLMLMGISIPPREKWDEWCLDENGLWWFNYYNDPEEKGIFANLVRLFLQERLPWLLATHSHRLTDFEIRGNRLYFIGNPSTRLPLLCTRHHRQRMKDIEREALLFAR